MLGVGALFVAVEDVIGGIVHQQRAKPRRLFCEYARRARVHCSCERRLAFRLVHCGIGGGIDDDCRLGLAHDSNNAIGVGQIEAGVVMGNHIAEGW